ncbi:methylenetetrahydrofolate reductase [NAD(P)H] [Nitrosomonas sp. Nm58]|uniref:methylenetetrahydrofolate reductase [NAD(P)H] n=1 Tax=Nitrosomonas sp. Nm58 TaxID=200126 RepID=UPI00089AC48B|nr:methylenetetrahydrofolate reductase [NAD(P)H] [Nitrosomonas sp. Nm58]SDY46664.1 methylenetetrahydrofolate reductase (NADPH) [Nitrosomonas sp. Nm58]
MRSQKNFSPTFSFELFPPQTPEGVEKLRAARQQLAQFKPKFFSVTFGAGGSTRDRTFETVLEILAEGHPVAPHLSCIGSTRENIYSILSKYQENGIRHIVALRGDLPSGMAQSGEFRYANELITFIRKEFGNTFHMEVAAYPEYHPQARSAQEDFRNFKNKIEAGADSVITQFFYNADAYFHFVDMCEAANLNVPIVPGIMPINKFSQLVRFADTCGAEIPRWIRKKLEGYGDDIASIHAFGLDVVTDLCERLLKAGAPGLHFYTLNSAVLTTKIWQRLGL